MRIGILIPHILTSRKYKERIFAPLEIGVNFANKLVERGHTVIMYTSKDVETKAIVVGGDSRLIDSEPSYYQFRNKETIDRKSSLLELVKQDFENDLTMKAYKDALEGKLDIIHSFHDFAAHYFDELTHFPTLYTLHNPLPHEENSIEYIRFSKFPNHNYISISDSQRKSIVKLNFLKTIYHGLDLNDYTYNDTPEKYLIYLGRIIEDKGVDVAIQIAKQLKLEFIIGTSLDPGSMSPKYFENKVMPFIDGEKIKLAGFLKKQKKDKTINMAKAFIFPVKWEEPFGLTIIESMACGTPVVAFARGSIPEIIKDGKTGFIVNQSNEDIRGDWTIKKTGIEGLIEAVERIYSMNEIEYLDMRSNCRKHVEDNFSLNKMVSEYENVYKDMLGINNV